MIMVCQKVSGSFKSYIPKVIKTNTINGTLTSDSWNTSQIFSFPGFIKTANVSDGEVLYEYIQINLNIYAHLICISV